MIEVKFDERSLKTAEAFFHVAPTAVKQAGAAAINRTLTHLKKASAMKVRERYVAKAGMLKTAMGAPKRATASNMSGVLDVKGGTLPLTAFNIKTPRSGPRRVQVLKKRRHKSSPRPVRKIFPERVPWADDAYRTQRLPFEDSCRAVCTADGRERGNAPDNYTGSGTYAERPLRT